MIAIIGKHQDYAALCRLTNLDPNRNYAFKFVAHERDWRGISIDYCLVVGDRSELSDYKATLLANIRLSIKLRQQGF